MLCLSSQLSSTLLGPRAFPIDAPLSVVVFLALRSFSPSNRGARKVHVWNIREVTWNINETLLSLSFPPLRALNNVTISLSMLSFSMSCATFEAVAGWCMLCENRERHSCNKSFRPTWRPLLTGEHYESWGSKSWIAPVGRSSSLPGQSPINGRIATFAHFPRSLCALPHNWRATRNIKDFSYCHRYY